MDPHPPPQGDPNMYQQSPPPQGQPGMPPPQYQPGMPPPQYQPGMPPPQYQPGMPPPQYQPGMPPPQYQPGMPPPPYDPNQPGMPAPPYDPNQPIPTPSISLVPGAPLPQGSDVTMQQQQYQVGVGGFPPQHNDVWTNVYIAYKIFGALVSIGVLIFLIVYFVVLK